MGRQLGIHHGQGQPRGITPPGQEGHQSATLPFLRTWAGPAATTGQSGANEFGRLPAILRDIDIRHRIGDMRLRHALVPEFPFESPARLTAATTPTADPLGRELRVVDQTPHPDPVQRLVDGLDRVLLVQQSSTQLVLAAGPVSE